MSEDTTATDMGDASASASLHDAQKDGGDLINFLRPASAGQNLSFSDVVRPVGLRMFYQ